MKYEKTITLHLVGGITERFCCFCLALDRGYINVLGKMSAHYILGLGYTQIIEETSSF